MPQTRIQPLNTPKLPLHNFIVLSSHGLKWTVDRENPNERVWNYGDTANSSNHLWPLPDDVRDDPVKDSIEAKRKRYDIMSDLEYLSELLDFGGRAGSVDDGFNTKVAQAVGASWDIEMLMSRLRRAGCCDIEVPVMRDVKMITKNCRAITADDMLFGIVLRTGYFWVWEAQICILLRNG
jgi:hypothetical protein